MNEEILRIAKERHDRIQCIYKCVNLNLQIIRDALKSVLSGTKEIFERINEISELASPAFGNRDDNFERYHTFVVSHYFVTLISEFEGFLVDILRIVVKHYPSKVGGISLKLSEVAECDNLDEAIEIGVNKFLNELVYKKPKEYIEAINQILSIGQSDEIDELWKQFIELKARRDLGIHNDWKHNDTYIRKVSECGGTPAKETFLAPNNTYFVEAVNVVHKLMTLIATHCVDKFHGGDSK